MAQSVINVGIIGLGRSGWGIHAQAGMAQPGHFKVVAVTDPLKARMNESAAALGARACDSVEELLARIRVALRHAAQVQAQSKTVIIHAGGLEINLIDHIVKRGDEEIKLTATEFKLLAYLAAHADRVLTHQAILSHVWDPADSDRVEYLRVYMRQLRKKLEVDPERPQFILTEPGIGYRFIADE